MATDYSIPQSGKGMSHAGNAPRGETLRNMDKLGNGKKKKKKKPLNQDHIDVFEKLKGV